MLPKKMHIFFLDLLNLSDIIQIYIRSEAWLLAYNLNKTDSYKEHEKEINHRGTHPLQLGILAQIRS